MEQFGGAAVLNGVGPAIVESQHHELLALDQRVDAAEGEGLKARWEFGHALLRKRVGKQLPHGLLGDLVEKTGKSRTELKCRVRFAETYPGASIPFRYVLPMLVQEDEKLGGR